MTHRRRPRTVKEVRELMDKIGPLETSILATSDRHGWVPLPDGCYWCCNCGILKINKSRYFVHDKTLPYAVNEEPACHAL